MCPSALEEGVGSPGVEVIGGWEPPGRGAENSTWVLQRTNTSS